MAELIITKGEEFKLTVKEKINKNDIFIDQYKSALGMINEIIEASMRESHTDFKLAWKNNEFENNIIAFCGNRGDGKSSAMLTLVNALFQYSKGKKVGEYSVFEEYSKIQNTYFAEPIVIDPTLFDDVHNVLDIILAKLYRNFDEKYKEDNISVDRKQREKLLDQFQKVYRYLSLINNQAQLLDDEYDYEGNIGKLSKLGKSTNLKDELRILIKEYLEFMEYYETEKNGKGERQLIVAIDDLDLCSSNAYKMAEQIRKYLIIPHITIVMAVRIEQLELCVEEQNCRNFENILKWSKQEHGQVDDEIKSMSERYVAKLIPKARRIYLPQVQEFDEVSVVYKEYAREGEKDKIIWKSSKQDDENKSRLDDNSVFKMEDENNKITLVKSVLNLIYEKTGMRFLSEKQGNSFLLPTNLRDMVSWIVLFADMDSPNKENQDENNQIYCKNIESFNQIFEKQWLTVNLPVDMGVKIKEISGMDIYCMHMNVCSTMNTMYTEFLNSNQTASIPYSAGGQNVMTLQNPIYYSERDDSFALIVEWMRLFEQNVFDADKRRCAYGFRVLYTIKINQLLRRKLFDTFWRLNGEYIWGGWFSQIIRGLPAKSGIPQIDRSRFFIRTWEAYNIIWTKMFAEGNKLIPRKSDGIAIISKIPEGVERERCIKSWILLGLLSNGYWIDSYQRVYLSIQPIVHDNYQLLNFVYVSVENYIVGLCNLHKLYDKVNMDLMGVKRKEFNAIVDKIEEYNKENILCARELASNMDLLLGIKEYCKKNNDYKKATSDEIDRSCKLTDKFFKNIRQYMQKYHMKGANAELQNFKLGESKEQEIHVSLLYAQFIKAAEEYQEKQQRDGNKAGQLTQEYRKKLTEFPSMWNDEMRYVPSFVKNAAAENIKNNLDNLAENIQRYIGIKKEMPDRLDIERICKLYSDVLSLYLVDKNISVTEEMKKEYKEIAKVNNVVKI